MNYLRSCDLTKLDTVRNEEIRRRAQVDTDIIRDHQSKKLLLYVHLQRMTRKRQKWIWGYTSAQRRR
jgi:hypothetical protein